MARLKIRLHGKTVYDVVLAEAQEYIAGRKEDCDFALQPEKGISREHFRMSFKDGQWFVEIISRYGELISNGERVQNITLSEDRVFSVPPYEFEFKLHGSAASAGPAVDHAPADGGAVGSGDYLPAVTTSYAMDFAGDEEKTVVGAAPMSAYIKIVDNTNDTKELIRLEAGDSWIAGRDSSANIQIRDPRVSRRQFEIRRAGSQYYIIDLGSVNGTLVNGSPISTADPLPIKSGDSISVLDNYLYFELHDSNFRSRLENINVEPVNPLVQVRHDSLPSEIAPYTGQAPMPYQPQMPAGYQMPPQMHPQAAMGKGKFDFQKHRPKLIAGAVAFLAIAYVFSGGDNKPAGGPANPGAVIAPGSPQEAFAKLKPEQQALIRQRYKDAKNLYMQGKYQNAQDEIVKITELVPDYEDIKEIERLSKEAMLIQEQQLRQDKIEKERAETEDKIQKQYEVCKAKINPESTVAQVEDCFSTVLQFNPDHPKIVELKSRAEALTAQRQAKEAERAIYAGQVAKLRALYDKAQGIEKAKKNPLESIDAYEKVLSAKLPDPNGYKAQSQRSIASLRQSMNTQTSALVAEADKAYQAQNLRAAVIALRKAHDIDPTNDELSDKIERYMTELRKQMMVIYQEGILEESFGNVEGGESKAGAKDKWKKILELDVTDGEYYKKATLKLKKYGAI
jgi:pSer/pThr/pTyr-binding forkhead associated (FHA) protein